MIPAGTVERGGSISLSNERAASTPGCSVFSASGAKCGKAVQEAVDERTINEFSLIFGWKRAT
jgi:hypothetical protein